MEELQAGGVEKEEEEEAAVEGVGRTGRGDDADIELG